MISYDKLRRWTPPVARQAYDERYCALYGLAHGLGGRADRPGELAYVARPLRSVFPTLPLALANEDRALEHGGTGLDYGQVVLGEQALTLHRAIPLAASVVSQGEVGSIEDKGAGRSAVITIIRRLYEEGADDPIATMSASYIARGQGGFGGPNLAGQGVAPSPMPDRSADAIVTLDTLPQLALIYDLTGDYVDFHVDPAAAGRAGFASPILHGLCTVGLVARAAMDFDPGASARIAGVRVRLGDVIYPGEALRFAIWKTDDGLRMQATAPGRNAIVVRDSLVSFREVQ